MPSPTEVPEETGLARLPRVVQWIVLLGVTAVVSAVLVLAKFPAEFLIGPMIAAVLVGVNGATIRLHGASFNAAQGVIGVLVAASISIGIFSAFLDDWYIFLAAVVGTLIASSALGWLISTWKIMPGTTGVWGSAPGASTAMVLMADAFGADARLVAVMQYLRVILVSIAATIVSKLWVAAPALPVDGPLWFPPIDWVPFLSTVAVVVAGGLGGRALRLPAPFFLGTFSLAVALHLGGGVSFQLPEWLLAISYTVIGWTIGLNFTRPILIRAMRTLPQIIASILALMAVCGAIAWILVQVFDIDPLTAYLATSPGGLDSVAIIAAASKTVDMSFVMSLQLARFLMVLLFGPAISKLVARHVRE
ncbi:AbrB family transcriptional regulator [Devosia sp.]|uniref:AbrB family transcriptional regulator n=1 Tax=Devosia sp. TaxID=1871048 RepID=UPI0019E63F1F|nr:AbrB family transcriptional regulator [Devosia sp.]MBE0578774.1 AbrB family transcriptional regulator [Devosia sp.]